MAEKRIRIHIAGSTVYKMALLFAVVAVSVAFMWYTYGVIDQLRSDAQLKVKSYVRLWVRAVDPNTPSAETQLIFDEIISQASFPIVVASDERTPNFWRNVPGVDDTDRSTEALKRIAEVMQEMKAEHGELEIRFGVDSLTGATQGVNYFYHGDSELIENLKIAPYIQIGMMISVLVIGLVGATNIKRSDERHIWVGMAKETAHQLGTPISSLMGWLQLLRDRSEKLSARDTERASDSSPTAEILDSMEDDVSRLSAVANRFGKIGSEPELKPLELNAQVSQTVEYYRRRLPFGGEGIQLSFDSGADTQVACNPELFSWAIENLVKNAMEAVDPRSGRIRVTSRHSGDGRWVHLQVTDNGKGIPLGVQRRIFRPGFSSKKRGWGLGLTLSQRIIEEYHNGKLTLVRSEPGETVFQVSLPVVEA